jgi:large subunit ribosomal protein L17
MLRNLASSLFLTERNAEDEDNAPKVKGRVITTLQKAKEVRPLVEKCITIARRSLEHSADAEQYASTADRGTEEWKEWRKSSRWQQWNNAISPAVAARRRAYQLLGDKQAVSILFEDVAPRFVDRNGGYTRILRLATPRLGDAGTRAIIEFVGIHDRVVERSVKPAFSDDRLDEQRDTKETQTPAEQKSPGQSAPSEPESETTSENDAAKPASPSDQS